MKLRLGKMISQGCHASIAFLTDITRTILKDYNNGCDMSSIQSSFSYPELEWINGKFTKICLQVSSEEELLDIHQKAKESGLKSYLITDSGLTKFHRIPTNTCLAIGPDFSSKIDNVTKHLKLL